MQAARKCATDPRIHHLFRFLIFSIIKIAVDICCLLIHTVIGSGNTQPLSIAFNTAAA